MSRNSVITMSNIDALVEKGLLDQTAADKLFDKMQLGVPVAATKQGPIVYSLAMLDELTETYAATTMAATGESASLDQLLSAIDAPEWVVNQIIPVINGDQPLSEKNAKRVGDAVGVAWKLWAASVPASMRQITAGSFGATWRSMFPKKTDETAAKQNRRPRRAAKAN